MINFNIDEEIPVMEHFYTVQGEGYFSGTAAYFVRLAGCDVGCHWCDVKESWSVDKQQLMKYDDLLNYIKSTLAKIVVITGGEPLMYNINTLVNLLKSNDYQLNIETSGSYNLTSKIDWICVSPKKFKPILPDVLAQANEIKCIIYNSSDFEFAIKNLETFKKYSQQEIPLYLQAEWSVKDKMYPKIIEFVKQNPEWKISVQVHKYLNIP